VRTTGITQSCSISQTSATANNLAIVYMSVVKTTGLTQNASQTAQIVQRATGGPDIHNNNEACVTQTMTISTSTIAPRGTPVLATLDGHQTLTINQDSAYGNNNASEAATSSSGGSCDTDTTHLLGQQQIIKQTATGSARIEQDENTHDQGPNLSLDIEQNKNGGGLGQNNTNKAVFLQDNTLTAIAKTPNGPVVQTQGTELGGLQAKVNQFSHGDSTADAHQTELQCASAFSSGSLVCQPGNQPSYDLTQTQWGQVRKGGCCSIQADNPNDTFMIDQSTTQDNNAGEHQGQTNLVQAECGTSGNCTATQTTNIDGTRHTNTESGPNVDTQTTCSGSTCTSSGPTTTGDLTLLPDGLSVANADVAEFGYGGMRGSGTGSITVSGVSAPVFHAFLYWNGPTNSTDPAVNAAVTFNGSAVTGTNIGVSGDNNWGFQNTQAYRAEVTSLVTGNGTYGLADFVKPDADINGVALIVFYDNGNSGDDRNVVLWNGDDSNCLAGGVPENWDETITGVPYQGGTASLDFVVADGQLFEDDALVLNGNTLVPTGGIFQGDSTPHGSFDAEGDLWDVKSFDMTSFLSPGSNDLHLTTGADQDCLSLVVAAANVPAAAPVISGPAAAVAQQSATAQPQVARARTTAPRLSSVGTGGVVAR
jgi:hypothetical protein